MTKNKEILNHIFEKYTGQEVLDCLSIEYPESYKYFYRVNILHNIDEGEL
jgi:hypothetical protein